MQYFIRDLRKEEYPLLEIFLYNAIYIPQGTIAPSRDIIYKPELKIYFENFGKYQDDIALVYEADKKIVAAIWVRIMNDYGHIDDETPSLSISVLEEYRGHGIGTKLLYEMLKRLKNDGYKRVSLSVQKENYAFKMYRKAGFEVFRENNEEYIMVCYLNNY